MSETPKLISQRVNDQAAAYELAHIQKPFKDVELAFIQDGQLEMAQQIALKGIAKVEESEDQQELDIEQPGETVGSHEAEDSHELVQTLLEEGTFLYYTHQDSSKISSKNVETKYGYGHAWDDNFAAARSSLFPSQRLEQLATESMKRFAPYSAEEFKKLADEGFDDAVIVRDLKQKTEHGTKPILFKNYHLESNYADEPTIAISYFVVGSFGEHGITGQDSLNRGSPDFRAVLFLPKSLADKFQSQLKADPKIMRKMMDYGVEQKLGFGSEEWKIVRQPYDKWRDLRGDKSKMLLLTIDGRETLEF